MVRRGDTHGALANVSNGRSSALQMAGHFFVHPQRREPESPAVWTMQRFLDQVGVCCDNMRTPIASHVRAEPFASPLLVKPFP